MHPRRWGWRWAQSSGGCAAGVGLAGGPIQSAAPTAPPLQAKQQDSQYNVVIDKEDVLAKVGGAGMSGETAAQMGLGSHTGRKDHCPPLLALSEGRRQSVL